MIFRKRNLLDNFSLVIGILFVIFFLIISTVYIIYRSHARTAPVKESPDPEQTVETLDEFGVSTGRYVAYSDVVRPSQTFSHIFSEFNLSASEIDQIIGLVKDVFDPKHVRSGQQYCGYFEGEDMGSMTHFIYEISGKEYLKLELSDEWHVSRVEHETHRIQKAASGIIHSSLWNAMTTAGLKHDLAIKMSQVLAWEVDFYRIQPGDRFKVIYQEEFVGDRSIGIKGIDAIYFFNYGREIYGFNFEEDTIIGFYNREGESLRKTFLKAPLEFVRISSRYSYSRLHPVLGYRRPHLGTDYAAPHGTPILAVGDGFVTNASYNSGNGNYVRIRHNSVYETQYLHMSRFAAGIRPGTFVTQGQVIGYVGSTGLATGPHVCFRFWKNGQQVDHLREEFPSSDPLSTDYLDQFEAVRDRMLRILEPIEYPVQYLL